jgi:hypothetical protein
MKIGIHGLFKRCVLLGNCKLGKSLMHRSAISSKHKGWDGRSVSTNGDLSKLIKGIFNSNPILKPLLHPLN